MDFAELLKAARRYAPRTVWIFADGKLDEAALQEFAQDSDSRPATVNVVRAASGPDDKWLAQWTASLGGSLTILANGAPSAVALDGHHVE
jgi:hypothetical protein